MQHKPPRILLIIFFLLSTVNNSYGWEEAGHMLVAKIAYKQVDKNILPTLDRLIKITDFEYPLTTDFVSASVWPDDLKKRDIKLFNNWHYQGNLFTTDKTPLPQIYSDGQAISTLKKLKKILLSSSATDGEKSFALKMYIHIFGDMHQPLHSWTLVSRLFPIGDERGKLFKLSGPYTDLHSFWDYGLGALHNPNRPLNSTDETWFEDYIQDLLQEYPRSSFTELQISAKYDSWQNENLILVKKYVYTNISYNTSPSDQYIVNNMPIIRKQLALAGLRLASQLNCIFKSEECKEPSNKV